MHSEIYQMLTEQLDMFPETHTLYEKKMENGKVVKHVKHLFGDRIAFMKDYTDHSQEGTAHQRMSMSMGRHSFASPRALGLTKSFENLIKRLPTASDLKRRSSDPFLRNVTEVLWKVIPRKRQTRSCGHPGHGGKSFGTSHCSASCSGPAEDCAG